MKFNKTKYDNEFIKENYDTIKITVKKGEKEKVINHYKKIGYNSMGEYIRNLINQDMSQGGGNCISD